MRIKNKKINKGYKALSYFAFLSIGVFEKDMNLLKKIKRKYDRDYRGMFVSIFDYCILHGFSNLFKNSDENIILKSIKISRRIRDTLSTEARANSLTNKDFTARIIHGFILTKGKKTVEKEFGQCLDVIKKIGPLGR